jgi:hypothetical protein
MTDTIPVSIGGEAIALPLVMNFAALQRVWPAIKAISTETDPANFTAAHLGFISALLKKTRPELTIAELGERLRVNIRTGSDERPGLYRAVAEIIAESGLVPEGEQTLTANGAAPSAQPAAQTATIQT